MKLNGNQITLTPRELTRLVTANEKTVARAKGLLLQRATRRRKPAPRRRYLRISDHQTYRLLRVAPELSGPHAEILSLWARRARAEASVGHLIDQIQALPLAQELPNITAWARLVVKQAVLRGDAVEVVDVEGEMPALLLDVAV